MTRAGRRTGWRRGTGSALGAVAALAWTLAGPPGATAQHTHSHTHTDEQELHFSHPFVSECVNPASMLAVGFASYTLQGAPAEHRLHFEGELGLLRMLSVQAHAQLDDRGTLRHFEVGLKAATFSFERSGLLLGYGLGLRVPVTSAPGPPVSDPAIDGPAAPEGHDDPHAPAESVHGHSAVWGLDPFVNFGFRRGPWELVGWTIVGVDAETRGPEVAYRASGALRVNPGFTALLEMDGPAGHGPDGDAVSVAPGVLLRPLPRSPLVLGLSAGVPLTHRETFGPRAEARLLWHF